MYRTNHHLQHPTGFRTPRAGRAGTSLHLRSPPSHLWSEWRLCGFSEPRRSPGNKLSRSSTNRSKFGDPRALRSSSSMLFRSSWMLAMLSLDKRKQDWGFKATKDDRTLPPWAPMPFISRFMLLMVVFVFRASASASHGKGRLGSKTSSAMPDCRTSQPSSPMLFERRLMLVMARLTINASARASQAIGIKLKPRAVSTARPGCHGVRCDSS